MTHLSCIWLQMASWLEVKAKESYAAKSEYIKDNRNVLENEAMSLPSMIILFPSLYENSLVGNSDCIIGHGYPDFKEYTVQL